MLDILYTHSLASRLASSRPQIRHGAWASSPASSGPLHSHSVGSCELNSWSPLDRAVFFDLGFQGLHQDGAVFSIAIAPPPVGWQDLLSYLRMARHCCTLCLSSCLWRHCHLHKDRRAGAGETVRCLSCTPIDFSSISSAHKNLNVWYMLIIPALGRQRWQSPGVDLWGSLANQLSLISKSQVPKT